MRFWTRIALEFGGIARVPLRGRHVYLVSDPSLLYSLFVTNRDKYRKNIRYKAAVDTFGHGLLLNEGEAWKRQRKITQPAFKADYIGQQVQSMVALTNRYLDAWEESVQQNDSCDVDREFLRLSQLLAGHYLMGPHFDEIEDSFHSAAIAIKDNWPLPPQSILDSYIPRSKHRERNLYEAICRIDDLLYGYLARRRKSEFENCGVLSTLVSGSRAQGDEFDDRSLRDQLLTLFFAGHETSAVSLSWIHYLLSEHSEVRARLQSEIRAVLGERVPTAEDLPKLTYTEQVIYEALRLYSPIHSVSRVALEDDDLDGHHIPAGSTIYVSLYATHRLPHLWPDPERFDPERFRPELCAVRPRFAFIPFAAGHRNCIGAAMATVELKIVIARIAQRYVLDLEPGHRVEQAAGTTMHPRYGMRMVLRHAEN
jgi:cytochrome P450